jgi:hypothetical protein
VRKKPLSFSAEDSGVRIGSLETSCFGAAAAAPCCPKKFYRVVQADAIAHFDVSKK